MERENDSWAKRLAVSVFCWMARPLVGSPNIKVEFVRADALESNFLESLFKQIIPHIIRKGAVS